MNFAVDGGAAGFALVFGDEVPDVPVQDSSAVDAEQVALGTIDPAHNPLAVDFVICDRSFFE